MPELDTDIRYIKGVGEQRAKTLARLGIATLGELLRFYPRAYEDRTVLCPIAQLLPEQSACIRAMIAERPRLSRIRGGLELVKLRVVDDSGALDVTFFNQAYLRERLVPGETWIFYGKVGGTPLRKTLTNPVCERDGAGEVTGRILPVYRLTHGVSNKQLIRMMRAGLDACAGILPERLPEDIRRENALCPADYACRSIHFPADFAALAQARRRLVFEELFTLSCALTLLRGSREKAPGLAFAAADMDEFYASLPFVPTGAQRRAVNDAVGDMCSGSAMSRLVQGDVGSGKTLVAAACLWLAWKNGWQSAFMAPTEILAAQHLRTLEGFLAPLGLRVGLLTGSLPARERRGVREALAAGTLDVAVGTHALLSGDVSFARLGLAVTDEQHRFGVAQRAALTGKGARPHVLVMSATPIPRTLALIIYGDLDVSVIDELPPGRQRVETFAVGESYRARLNAFIQKQADAGRQVFVVCPMVEENDELPEPLTSATEHAARLQETFPALRVGCVHGKMKPREKDAAMRAFAAGETDILVSTTVVEVGVDVPNASLMIVENAERFGLSQLHQLRGRVGRGVHQSYCVLVSDARGDTARARLRALCATNDGFAVAEEDLKLRGPGDFFGSRQHGLPEMHVAGLLGDMDVLKSAQSAAQALMAADPALSAPEHAALRRHIDTLFPLKEGTLN